MGWADPTNWVGLSPKGLGRSRPNSSLCFFGSGPDPAQTSGLGQNRPSLEKEGGELFPPRPSSCMQNEYIVLHAGGDEDEDE